MDTSELPSLSLIFLLTPHLLLKQADITSATKFHKPFLFQLKTDLDLPSELAARAERAARTRFVYSSSSPLTHVVN